MSRGHLARAVGVVGEILITLGVVMALFVVYELWWTGQQTARAQDELTEQLTESFAAAETDGAVDGAVDGDASPGAPTDDGPPPADAVALLRIPRLGARWEWAVVDGVSRSDLKRGPGHYPDSAMPGEVGNFAVAGHRRTYGQPFVDLDRVEEGDLVYVETAAGWVTYEVDSSEVVPPNATDVVLPVPKKPGVEPTERLLTLTTCWPKNSSSKRLIVYGHLVDARSRDQGPPPSLEQ